MVPLIPFDYTLVDTATLIGAGGVVFGALVWVIRLSIIISKTISGSRKSLNETFVLLEKAGEIKSARPDLGMYVGLELDSIRHELNTLIYTIIIYIIFIVLGYLALYIEIIITEISGVLPTSYFDIFMSEISLVLPTSIIYIASLIFLAFLILVMLIMWLRLNVHLRYCEKRLRKIWKKAVADRLAKGSDDIKGIKL